MDAAIEMDRLDPGFINPVFDAQTAFRAVLHAMTHPGQSVTINADIFPPVPLNIASAAVCLTLLDFETTLWSDMNGIDSALSWLGFHCGCKIVSHPSAAMFALITNGRILPPLDRFRIGSDECPDLSTTLIVQVDAFSSDNGRRLTGPGIRTARTLRVQGIDDDFWDQWQEQNRIFPLGVDVMFTHGNTLTALPRSTRIEG